VVPALAGATREPVAGALAFAGGARGAIASAPSATAAAAAAAAARVIVPVAVVVSASNLTFIALASLALAAAAAIGVVLSPSVVAVVAAVCRAGFPACSDARAGAAATSVFDDAAPAVTPIAAAVSTAATGSAVVVPALAAASTLAAAEVTQTERSTFQVLSGSYVFFRNFS